MTPDLLHAPYAPPQCRPGDWLDDAIHGAVEVGGWSPGRISWPRRKKTGRASLILCGELVRAVRLESVEAVCYWWGVGPTTVWSWRRALGVDRVTVGTRRLLQERTGVPDDAAAKGRANAARAESIKKMADSKRGRPMHPNTRDALHAAARAPKKKGWGRKANAWMQAAKTDEK